MKSILLALPLLLVAFTVDSDNWLQNGDFSEGLTHWRGSGRSPDDYARDNPLGKPDPFLSKGMIIPLKHATWLKVEQNFRMRKRDAVLTITYKVSPTLSFSKNDTDYSEKAAEVLNEYWVRRNLPVGQFLAHFSQPDSDYYYHVYEIKPKLGSSDVQTFTSPVSNLLPQVDTTLTLAFPPGDGNLVILSVTLQDAPAENQ